MTQPTKPRQPKFLTQHEEYKRDNPGKIVLVRMPRPFVHAAFGDDAVRVADACQVSPFDLIVAGRSIRAVYLNSTAIVSAIGMLTEAGHEVAVIDD